MAGLSLIAVGRPEIPRFSISARLRSQLVYFMSSQDEPGVPALGESEYWIAAADVTRWLDDGVFYLVSPLDSSNQTEVELSEEQEVLLEWLRRHGVQHVQVAE